jgi:hypothetical protein
LTSIFVLLLDLLEGEGWVFLRVAVKALDELQFSFLVHSAGFVVGSLGLFLVLSGSSKLHMFLLMLVCKTSKVRLNFISLSKGISV